MLQGGRGGGLRVSKLIRCNESSVERGAGRNQFVAQELERNVRLRRQLDENDNALADGHAGDHEMQTELLHCEHHGSVALFARLW